MVLKAYWSSGKEALLKIGPLSCVGNRVESFIGLLVIMLTGLLVIVFTGLLVLKALLVLE